MLEGSDSFHPSEGQGIASCLLAPFWLVLVHLRAQGAMAVEGDPRAAQVEAKAEEPYRLHLAAEQDAAPGSAQAQSAQMAAWA